MGKKTIIVGPMPPPYGGATKSFETFLEEWINSIDNESIIINSSPKYQKVEKKLRLSDFIRGCKIILKLLFSARKSSEVIMFLSTSTYIRLAGFLKFYKRLFNKKVILSFFGSNLFDYLNNKNNKLIKNLALFDRIIVETEYLKKQLTTTIDNVTNIPGYRKIKWDKLPKIECKDKDNLNILFLSQIRRSKGVFILLDALENLNKKNIEVRCDFFGPIDPAIEEKFHNRIKQIKGANFKGIARGDIINLMSKYDVLVLPTWYSGEGHPGVIIEAMMAGIPVIATNHKAIPELITHGDNGLLVRTKSVSDLEKAIQYLYKNPEDIKKMGQNNRESLKKHDVANAILSILKIVKS